MLQAWCTGDKPGSWESIDDGDFAAFRRLIHVLRGPDGCPWDRVQTFESLKDCIKNESDEVLEGIDRYQATGDAANLCEELGDVLMHVVLLSDLAEEKGLFQLEDVVREIGYKMLRRHPHVFGEEAMRGWKGKVTGDIGQLPRSWDEIKQLEKSIFRS
jgi:tetrapyrrole methylase family protein/MazG family protein